MTFGYRRSTVLVPPTFLAMPEEQQRAVLTHEFLHVRRRDWLFCLAEEIAAALMWFHPGVLFLVSRIRSLREQVVDAEALAITAARQTYIEALLSMAQARPMLDVATAPLFLRKRELSNRIRTILDGHHNSTRRIVWSYAAVAAVVAATAVYSISRYPLMGAPVQGESEIRGVVSRIDVSRLPQPLRSLVEEKLRPYRNAHFTTDLMMRVRAEVASLDSKIEQNWLEETPNAYSVRFYYPAARTTAQPLLVRIDASRLPDTVRPLVEARMSTFLNAPFSNQLMSGIEATEQALDGKIVHKWTNEAEGNLSVSFLYDVPEGSWKPIFGVLAAVDVSALPEPGRSRLEQRLAKYINAPFTNELQGQIGDDVAGIVRGTQLEGRFVTWEWRSDALGNTTMAITPVSAVGPWPPIPPAAGPAFPAEGEIQIRVGGKVQETKLKRVVPPVYPPLARQARVQGTVRFNVQIGRDGLVKAMQLISGHPLLVEAAKNTIDRYEYEPTVLNGEPVQVITTVDVTFRID